MNFYLVVLKAENSIEQKIYNRIIQQVLLLTGFIAAAAAITELLSYFYQIRMLSDGVPSARISLDLLLDLYRVLFIIRLALLVVGVTALVVIILRQRHANQPLLRLLTPIYIIFLGVLVSEVLGRFLFYAIHVRTGI
jgi:DMSO reductase anchor subunit